MDAHTRLYVHLPTKDNVMFMEVFNPNSDFHIRRKVAEFRRKMKVTYLEIYELADHKAGLEDEHRKVSMNIHRESDSFRRIKAMHTRHEFVDTFYSDNEVMQRVRSDERICNETNVATVAKLEDQIHKIDLQILNLSDEIRRERDEIVEIRSNAMRFLAKEPDDELYMMLDEILQIGNLRSKLSNFSHSSNQLQEVR